jgi:hypothetical protein
MSRYYDLVLTNSASPAQVIEEWASHPKGVFDPGALNIQFDILITPYDTPSGGQTITVEGISLSDLQQGTEYAGLNFSLKAGMAKGLPLANPTQAGLIAYGFIFQSFAKWVGTEMNLNFVVYPGAYTINQPGNLVLNWTAGTPLSSAIRQTLSTAYPGIPININISPNLVLDYDQVGYYANLNNLAQTVSSISQGLGHQVYITFQNGALNVFDDTYKPTPIQIQFTDLIGQPMWIQSQIMQVALVMRADIQVGSYITMPKGFQNLPNFINTAGASLPSSFKYKSAFQGNFQVVEMRQLGDYRAADGQQWVTIINCAVT